MEKTTTGKTTKPRPISWETILQRAKKRGKFTVIDKLEANSWATCAIGEFRSSRTAYVKGSEELGVTAASVVKQAGIRISQDITTFGPLADLRLNNSGPFDDELDLLGMRFMRLVGGDEVDAAIETYREIRRRVQDIEAGAVEDVGGVIITKDGVFGEPRFD